MYVLSVEGMHDTREIGTISRFLSGDMNSTHLLNVTSAVDNGESRGVGRVHERIVQLVWG